VLECAAVGMCNFLQPSHEQIESAWRAAAVSSCRQERYQVPSPLGQPGDGIADCCGKPGQLRLDIRPRCSIKQQFEDELPLKLRDCLRGGSAVITGIEYCVLPGGQDLVELQRSGGDGTQNIGDTVDNRFPNVFDDFVTGSG
jgi:hypothetical protein